MRYADFPDRNHGIDTMSGLNTIVLRNMTPFKLRKKGKKKEEDKMSLRNLSISMQISIAWSLSLQFYLVFKKITELNKLNKCMIDGSIPKIIKIIIITTIFYII